MRINGRHSAEGPFDFDLITPVIDRFPMTSCIREVWLLLRGSYLQGGGGRTCF